MVDVDALVALQADQPCARGRRQGVCDLGLADTRLALDEQRLAELGRQVGGRRQRAVGEVVLPGECLADRVGGGERRVLVLGQAAAAWRSARAVSTRARWRL
jgi:hypothetical protein